MEEIKKKVISKIIVILIIFASVLGISTVANADDVIPTKVDAQKTFNKGDMLPERNTSGSSGMLPQSYGAWRNVRLSGGRENWQTDSWSASMDGQIVYCSAYGKYVRYGFYEDETHYLTPDSMTVQGKEIPVSGDKIKGILDEFFTDTENYYKTKVINGVQRWVNNNGSWDQEQTTLSITYEGTGEIPKGGEVIGYAISDRAKPSWTLNTKIIWKDYAPNGYEMEGNQIKKAESDSKTTMENILNNMGHEIWPSKYSESVDGEFDNPEITSTQGPEVVVLEQTDRANDHYKENGGTSYGNSREAFIFTACEDVYDESKQYAKNFSLNDIQGAFWMSLGQAGPGDAHITAGAVELFDKANEYDAFLKEIAGGYSASIDTSLTQVIADRENKEYIVGPYTINYPYHEDISYVKSLVINDKLVYDEQNQDFEIILYGDKGVKGSNGMKKEYPISGQKFFIKVSANAIGLDTKELTLKANFEYINSTSAKVETILTANADIFKYEGYCKVAGNEYLMEEHDVSIKISYVYALESEWYHSDGCRNPECTKENPICGGQWSHPNDTSNDQYTFHVYIPYVKMKEEKVKSAQAQKLVVIGDANREYKIHREEKTVDLTMELGGMVWEDAQTGKTSEYDGLFIGEKPIPNIEVTLYKEDGSPIETARTDGEGKYLFTDLLPMYQYYMKFTYNGQYYQPTIAVSGQDSSNGWGSGTWQTNSNAMDKVSEREKYNLVFEKIGSSPENYEGSAGKNKSYTRKELMEAGVIDEFGNLIGGSNSSMVQYVKDCMMNSYTITASEEYDKYPTPPRFLINKDYPQGFKWPEAPRFLASKGIGGIAILYDDAYYINLGLVHREESDLAIKKDIDHVTLEINGQTHTYTYDTLDVFKCSKCGHTGKNEDLLLTDKNGNYDGDVHCPKCYSTDIEQLWDIGVELADTYYGKNYSREIYKSDYIYKASMYGNNAALLNKTKDDELEVYITYKIMIRNQSLTIQAKIDELVDFYDKDLEYIDERSYIQIKQAKGANADSEAKEAKAGIYEVKASDKSRYSNSTITKIDGYDNLYVTGLDDKYLIAGQTAYVYLTFKVKKEESNGEAWVKLDEIIEDGSTKIGANEYDVGKENIVEINGYSTRYPKGATVPTVGGKRDVSYKPAGIVDRDSNPGNLNPNDVPKNSIYEEKDDNNYKNFEDDTSKAPNMRIILNRDDETTRLITGQVWEDLRNQEIGNAVTANGIKEDNETLINGITVQLVEITENGEEFIWREFGNVTKGDTEKYGGTGTTKEESPIINAIVKGNSIRLVPINEIPELQAGEKLFIPNYEFENVDGAYSFKSYMPGKYVVRFIYGDTIKTVAPSELNSELKTVLSDAELKGLNIKSYNGQDYKSTTYQKGVEQYENGNNKTYTWRKASTWVNGIEKLGEELSIISTYKNDCSNNETASLKLENGVVAQNYSQTDKNNKYAYLYDIAESDKLTNVSDAKDIESRRYQVNDYSNDNAINYIAEVLASHKFDYDTMNNREQLLKDLEENTKMIADTGLMVIELEYNQKDSDGNYKKNTYKIKDVNLGLEERPKAQLAIDKQVTNAKITLANGAILFDAKQAAENLLWRDHQEYDVGYSGKVMDPSKYMTNGNYDIKQVYNGLEYIRNSNKSKVGLIQMSMDEELMHGANIEITYQTRVTNIGEVDYYNEYQIKGPYADTKDRKVEIGDRQFYYTGEKSNNAKVVTTSANHVIDYVANNLQFNQDYKLTNVTNKEGDTNGSYWNVVTGLVNDNNKQTLVNNKLEGQVEKYNTIIVTEKLNDKLVPLIEDERNASVSVPLILTQLITSENDTDDLTYKNIVEIINTSNTVGRRMEYSVVGNQDPTISPQELDSDQAEVVKILPPFGSGINYIAISLIVLGTVGLITLIIFYIKKEILIKKI